jgi:hypothetical protein
MSKARLFQVEKRARKFADRHGIDDYGPKFLDAFERGMILCKDGEERTVDQWLKTLAPYLPEKIAQLSDPGKAPGNG